VCSSDGSRALPTNLGMRLWPAAHPQNPQHVDLIVAPEAVCRAYRNLESCNTIPSIVMGDNVIRYLIGTASDLHMEPAEDLSCSAA
jgi:hypothetical protein